MYEQTAICCTLNNVPTSTKILQNSRLPFGLHLFPFAYDEQLPRSKDGLIVRCAVCRAYINPYVRIPDKNSWQCNLCYRYNELPPQFIYDYANRQYYDLESKIELTSESVEYSAGVEYMVRPPQQASYIFVFDCSKAACDIGYIPVMAAAIADLLDEIPGDARASIGFIGYDSKIHYFSFNATRVIQYTWPDLTVTKPPCVSDDLLVNMTSKREMIIEFLNNELSKFPNEIENSNDNRSALGPAVKAAVKILTPIGGKITILLGQLPNHGNPEDGCLLGRKDEGNRTKIPPNDKNGDYLTHLLNPAIDFYKSLALECCEHQISIDIFNLATTYVDLASIGPLAKVSAGSVFHYANSPSENKYTLIRFDEDFRNFLARPIGLESVLRLRFTRGLKISNFHGNFFVRSPNLLVLPNANPDASFALQIALEDDLKPEEKYVYFQASVLYTTPDGERRIRVHTARFPTVTTLPEVLYGANQSAIVAMLAKMAVDRSLQVSIGEAKEALIGSGVDLLEVYAMVDDACARSYAMGLPENIRSVPLYILALLKHRALKLDSFVKLDDRFSAMERFKTIPVDDLITYIYPDLIAIHNIMPHVPSEDWKFPIQLSAAHIERNGAYLLDAYDVMIIYVGQYVEPHWCYHVFGVNDYSQIPEHQDVISVDAHGNYRPRDPSNFIHPSANNPNSSRASTPVTNSSNLASDIAMTPLVVLPELDNEISLRLRNFISGLIDSRPQKPKFYIIKETSRREVRNLFTQYLIDDRSENYHSYGEFWKFLQEQGCK